MPRGTKNSILDQLEEDLLAWEGIMPGKDRGNGQT